MSNNTEYIEAIKQAEFNLADLRERGEDAIGEDWDDLRRELFTPEEIAASDLRVAVMLELVKARQERGISQKTLEELSGVRQPIIARMEKGHTSPQLNRNNETFLNILKNEKFYLNHPGLL